MTNTTVGREPLQIIEIVQPRCSNTYGSAPCTALGTAGNECFNTRQTCQNIPNYDPSNNLNWRFSSVDANRPLDAYSASAGDFSSNPIPILISASTTPTELNIGGTGNSSTAFGTRATLSFTLQDIPYDDSFADPYLSNRSYIATDQGTLLTKWLARNPYYINYVVRIYDGYHGQTLAQMQVREYLIDTISNPDSNGIVKGTAKDPLRLTDRSRNLFPPVSNMTLKNAIGTTGVITVYGTLADLDQQILGTTRVAQIGDELISYTSVTQVVLDEEYTLNGIARGVGGTIAATADAGEAFQRVGWFNAQRLDTILNTLLFTSAGANIDSAYYTLADWQAEIDDHAIEFASMSAYVTEPTPIQDLVAELADHCGFSLWWDDRAKKIPMRFIRPPDATPSELNQDNHILAGSLSIVDDHHRRVSRVALSYDPYNQLEIGKQSDFKNTYIKVNATYEGNDLYGEVKNKRHLSRWITTSAQAARTTTNTLNLLAKTPKIISFSLDAKDRDIWTGSIVDIEHRSIVDEKGLISPKRFFIISAQEAVSGEIIKYKAIEFNFVGRFAIIMADTAPIFTLATVSERESGGWISDDSGLMSDGSEGYKIQ